MALAALVASAALPLAAPMATVRAAHARGEALPEVFAPDDAVEQAAGTGSAAGRDAAAVPVELAADLSLDDEADAHARDAAERAGRRHADSAELADSRRPVDLVPSWSGPNEADPDIAAASAPAPASFPDDCCMPLQLPGRSTPQR